MKHLHLITLLASFLALASCRHASVAPPPDDWGAPQQQHKRVIELESQLDGLRHTTDQWQIACASLGIGALVLLIFGTALGAKTRHDALATP